MEIVKLKNGAEEAKPLVVATMMSLDRLMDEAPMILYELVMICRDPEHELFGNAGNRLLEFGLLESNGCIHQSIRNIVLSATEGDGIDITLGNPIDLNSRNTGRDRPTIQIGKSISLTETYQAVRYLADMVFDLMPPDIFLDDRRGSKINPHYNQTQQGIFFEIYYSIPGWFWTPWGKWNCFGSVSGNNTDDFLRRILEEMNTTLHREVSFTKQGQFGPVYAVHRAGDIVLPDPIERPRSDYLSSAEAREEWDALTVKWQHSKHSK